MKIAVIGASGRMGQAMGTGLDAHPSHEVVAWLDRGDEITEASLAGAEVAIEFTTPSASLGNVLALVNFGVHCVVGTTGWTEESLDQVRSALADRPEVGVLIAPNFALSAVLAMSFAEKAARFFESVEVIELHHPDKLDAPSGTAVTTAERIGRARHEAGVGPSPDKTETDLGSRGADIEGVRVHAVRLRGMTAHEEILLGNAGEQLSIRTDCFDRASFLPGVQLAVEKVAGRPGLTWGLEPLLDL